MVRAVLDTNVLVSGIIHPLGPSRQIIEHWHNQAFLLITSPALFAELVRVLRYPRIATKYKISESDIRVILSQLLTRAEITAGATIPLTIITQDPTDNLVLACADEGAADYIVSGDVHLLRLESYRDTQVIPPKTFLEILSEAN